MKFSKFLVLVKRLGIIGVDVETVTVKQLLALDEFLVERQEQIKTLEDVQRSVDQFFKSNK